MSKSSKSEDPHDPTQGSCYMQYLLMEHQNKNPTYNMYGEPLIPDIFNILENVKLQ